MFLNQWIEWRRRTALCWIGDESIFRTSLKSHADSEIWHALPQSTAGLGGNNDSHLSRTYYLIFMAFTLAKIPFVCTLNVFDIQSLNLVFPSCLWWLLLLNSIYLISGGDIWRFSQIMQLWWRWCTCWFGLTQGL